MLNLERKEKIYTFVWRARLFWPLLPIPLLPIPLLPTPPINDSRDVLTRIQSYPLNYLNYSTIKLCSATSSYRCLSPLSGLASAVTLIYFRTSRTEHDPDPGSPSIIVKEWKMLPWLVDLKLTYPKPRRTMEKTGALLDSYFFLLGNTLCKSKLCSKLCSSLRHQLHSMF